MTSTKAETQYDGSTVSRTYARKASPGRTFLILDLDLELRQGRQAVLAWKDLQIKDSQGGSYSRLPDDGFLALFGRRSMSSVDLNFGRHKGSICFELPQDVPRKGLALVYEGGFGREEMPLSVGRP